MSASYPTKLLLAFKSGNVCAFPACGKELTVDGEADDAVIIGEAAHIAGEKPAAARYDKNMPEEKRDHYENLIYLCGDHHTQIDKQENDFSVADLLTMKDEHEAKVRNAMNDGFENIGFPELEEATEWVANLPVDHSFDDFSLLPPDEKIKKNTLSNSSRMTIVMGLCVAKDVQAFIENMSMIDSDFPERLKAGFLHEYYRLRKEGFGGDDLFDLMCKFSQRGFREQGKRSAGLAVLIHLFESCDVFEK